MFGQQQGGGGGGWESGGGGGGRGGGGRGDGDVGFTVQCESSSVPDPISSYIVGPYICTETMVLNGYINILHTLAKIVLLVPICSLG